MKGSLAAEAAEGRSEVGRWWWANSTTRLLREVGIRGQAQRKAVKELATVAEKKQSLAVAEEETLPCITDFIHATNYSQDCIFTLMNDYDRQLGLISPKLQSKFYHCVQVA